METKEIKIDIYTCSNCGKEYRNMKSCGKHETKCVALENLFEHDSKFTYPTNEYDLIGFYRYGNLNWSRKSYPVGIKFDRQSSITEGLPKLILDYPFGKETPPSETEINHNNIKNNMFNWIDCEYNDNEVFISSPKSTIVTNSRALLFNVVSIHIIYENGDVDIIDEQGEEDYRIIKIKKDNRIVNIKIIDKPIEIFEVINQYVIPSELSNEQVFYPKKGLLLDFAKGNWSVEEDIARYFVLNTKLKDLPEYFTLDGNRLSDNTDDWLNVKSLTVDHFQGSQCDYRKGGIKTYGGDTEEEGLLTKFLFENSNRFDVKYFLVGDRRIEFKGGTSYSNPRKYRFYENNEKIDSDTVIDLIKKNKQRIIVKYFTSKQKSN